MGKPRNEYTNDTELIRDFLGCFSNWEKYRQYYRELVNNYFMNPEKVKNPQKDELDFVELIKDLLPEEEWRKVADYLDFAANNPDKPIPTKKEAERVRLEDIRKREAEERKKQELLRLEELKRKHDVEYEKLTTKIKNNFENVFDYYNNEIDKTIINEEEYRNIIIGYVQDWAKRRGDIQIPSDEQALVIAAPEKNVEVVARAGSGKSTTLISRALFLIDNCNTKPNSILFLAFNRKAAESLEKKLNEFFPVLYATHPEKMPNAMTFHSLANHLVQSKEELLDEKKQLKFIKDLITELYEEKHYKKIIKKLIVSVFKNDIEREELFSNPRSYYIYIKNLPYFTLKGDEVKSHGEKRIANFLFENDIEYKYEKGLTLKTDNGRITVFPDFSVFKADGTRIIIEYFGLEGDKEYDLITEKKKRNYECNNVETIYIYPHEFKNNNNSIESILAKKLKNHGVTINPLTEDELWEKMEKTNRHCKTDLETTLRTFVTRCRKNAFTPRDLSRKILTYRCSVESERLFLELANTLYKRYHQKLKAENKVDFEELLVRAVEEIKKGVVPFTRVNGKRVILPKLTNIFVDEYQDYSFLFEELLDTIRNYACPNAKMMCVGDDWQSIYSFAGADIKYFDSFINKHGSSSKRYYMTTNYRSKKDIVEIGNAVMRNSGSETKARAYSDKKGEVYTAYLNFFKPSELELYCSEDEYLMPLLLRILNKEFESGNKVTLLCRNNRIVLAYNGRFQRSYRRDNEKLMDFLLSKFPDYEESLRVSTIHSFKGGEDETVILLDGADFIYPFIHPYAMFNRIFGDTYDKLIDSEQRLFYVAMTRAINRLIVISDNTSKPLFMNEQFDEIATPLNYLSYEKYAIIEESVYFVRVSNRSSCNKSATINIKEELKAAEFIYNGENNSWSKVFKAPKGINFIRNQKWSRIANDVVVEIEDYLGNRTKYTIENGIWKIS